LITQKDLDEFLMFLKVFPGHRIKVVAFLENLKRIFNNGSAKSTMKKTTTKRFHSVNSNRIAKKNLMSAEPPKIKPKSVENLRTNNRIIKSFAKGSGFGFNYYLDNNDETSRETQGTSKMIRDNVQSGHTQKSDLKTYKEEHIENINEEIDKLLNYYMVQLNDKLDDSVDSLDQDDSSLSNMNSMQNLNNLSNLNVKSKCENISEIQSKSIQTPPSMLKSDREKVEKLNEIINSNKNFPEKTNPNLEKSKLDNFDNLEKLDKSKKSEKLENSNLDKSKSKINSNEQKFEKLIPDDDIEEEFYNNYDDIKIEEDEQPQHNNKNLSQKNSTKPTPSKDLENKNLKQTPGNNKSFKQDQSKVQGESEKNYIPDESYDSDVRLVKSCEENYVRQHIDQFDVEYMCRCLGLALMKHLESGQEKQHIMELIDFKKNFNFFNSLFNVNIEFFNTFFNMENQDKISNLDKLDLQDMENREKINIQEKEKENEKLSPSTKESTPMSGKNLDEKSFENKLKPIQPISFMSKMQKDHFPQNDNLSELHHSSTGNICNQLTPEIEAEIKTINDFFSAGGSNMSGPSGPYDHYGAKLYNSRYKNVNENTKQILIQDLKPINEIDSLEYTKINSLHTVEHKKEKADFIDILRQSCMDFVGATVDNEEECQENPDNQENIKFYDNCNENLEDENEQDYVIQEYHGENFEKNLHVSNLQEKNENILVEEGSQDNQDNLENKFNNLNISQRESQQIENVDEYYHQETPLHKINEEIRDDQDQIFESGVMESNYIIDVTNAEKLKNYLLKTSEIYDDDYEYSAYRIIHKRFVPPPDPQQIFEFCANIIIMTKMEKEVIMICLIYIERLIFNTGLLLNSRNWKRIIFTSLVIASKIWDDDSFENNHFAQVFPHLKIGEINMLERTFLELINYKVYVKCSEYFKYFFIVKSIALKYNFNGFNLVPMSVEKMMKLQESAYLVQKKLRRKYNCNNSAQF
jgi:hypothetical protein